MFYIIQNFDTKEYIKGKNNFNSKIYNNDFINIANRIETKIFKSKTSANKYVDKNNYNIPSYFIGIMLDDKDIIKFK